MELKGRLAAIAAEVPACDIVCDIGTDHAYIPIYLVKYKVCKRALAADVRKGPIRIAQKNIEQHRLAGLIETRLGNGLLPIALNDIDVVIAAGMGGMLIRDIIMESPEKARRASRLVLQPMNAIELLREWLYSNGFEILSEVLSEEGRKIYNVISARWTGQNTRKEDLFYHIGEKLLEKKDPLLRKYVERKVQQLNVMVTGMEKSQNGIKEINRFKDLTDRMQLLLRTLESSDI